SGTLPGGLANGGLYFAIRVDADTFKLAASQSDAFAGMAIDLTSDSSGVIYLDPVIYPGRVSVGVSNGAADLWGYIVENGLAAEDMLRLITRELVAKFSKVGNDYTIRDLADTKDSHSAT